MNFLMILLIWIAGAMEPLSLADIQFIDTSDSASCKILNHRAREREKIIREHLHIYQQNYDDQLLKAMKLNHLLINQLLLEPEIWRDESVEVVARFKATPRFVQKIQEQGLDQIFFVIQGPGIQWRAQAFNFPKAMQWSYHPQGQELQVVFQIYKGALCFEALEVQLSWSELTQIK